MAWLFLALLAQSLLLATLGRSPGWRALGRSGLPALLLVGLLWHYTDGGSSRSEAWLVLTALPLLTIGFFAWRQALGKLAMALGVSLSLGLLVTWYWAAYNPEHGIAAIIAYSVLVLIAMVALFMIGGVLAMRRLIAVSDGKESERGAGQGAGDRG